MTGENALGANPDVTTRLSPRTVSATLERLVALLAAKQVKLFDVIDQQREARSVGLEMPEMTLVIFGNPLAGTPVMIASPLAALDLPLKILLWSDGSTTRVSYLSPPALAKRYGLNDELAGRLAIIDHLANELVTEGN